MKVVTYKSPTWTNQKLYDKVIDELMMIAKRPGAEREARRRRGAGEDGKLIISPWVGQRDPKDPRIQLVPLGKALPDVVVIFRKDGDAISEDLISMAMDQGIPIKIWSERGNCDPIRGSDKFGFPWTKLPYSRTTALDDVEKLAGAREAIADEVDAAILECIQRRADFTYLVSHPHHTAELAKKFIQAKEDWDASKERLRRWSTKLQRIDDTIEQMEGQSAIPLETLTQSVYDDLEFPEGVQAALSGD